MSKLTNNPLVVIPVWDAMMTGARAWTAKNGFINVSGVPHIAGASGSCEDWANTLAVEGAENFFGKKAFLVQSGQLYIEGLTHLFGKVCCEIQSFRKEVEVDNRHLVQFTLFEIEHLGDLSMLMDNIDGLFRSCVEHSIPILDRVLPERGQELRKFLEKPILRVSYTEAVEALQEYFDSLSWGDDLKASHEAKIVEHYGGAVLLHTFPTHLKFWNMLENEGDTKVVDSCDLLLPFSGEAAGAAQRTTNYDDLVRRLHSSDMYRLMREQGVKDEEFDWYLDQHKSGEIRPHSGAGVGMARVAQFILGVDDIREAVPFVVNKESLL